MRAIERAIDLDGAQLAAGVFQFASLHQLFRVEVAAPRSVGPAADADADLRGKIANGNIRVIHRTTLFDGLRRVSTVPMHSTSQAAPAV